MFFFFDQSGESPKTFHERMERAYKTSSLTPEKMHGRNVWIADRLRELGTPVSPESVRKWFSGLTQPRGDTLSNLAQVLGVAEEWLTTGALPGAEPAPEYRDDLDEDDEARMFSVDLEAFDIDRSDQDHERERIEGEAAAEFVAARLMFAGLNARARERRVLVEGKSRTREVAVSLLHKAADRGGLWMARLPEQNSAFPPLTAPFEILMFVLPRGGREPALFPVLGKAAARLGPGGAVISVSETSQDGEPVLAMTTRKGTPVFINPMPDLAVFERFGT